MSYQVIARKYRPQRFADVVGQEHVTQTLANAIERQRIAHAYLFVGPRGTGKTTLARIFAKCLNCTGGPKVDFSDDDPRCQEIAQGRSLDVLEIDGASNRGIEEIRELRETVKYAPATSRFKIYIIDEVHMLTKEAFNALLKTLEEPPAHVKFMFATTEPEKVLTTILSRCQRFDLRRIPTALIVAHLAQIAALENVKIDAPALHAIARGADGGMRDAQSALDQLISFCGEQIVEEDVLAMFGLTAGSQVLHLAQAMLDGDNQEALRALDGLAKKGKDLTRLLADLLGHFRNLLLFQVSQGDLSLLDVSETEAGTLREQSGTVTGEALTRVMDVLSEYEGRLRDAASKRILIEVALLKAIQARNFVSIDSVLQKLRTLQNQGEEPDSPPRPSSSTVLRSRETVNAAAPGPVSPPVLSNPVNTERNVYSEPGTTERKIDADIEQCSTEPDRATETPRPVAQAPGTPSASMGGQVDVVQLWTKIVEAVGRVSPFARTYLLEAHPVSLKRNVFTIGFDPEFSDHLGLIDNPRNRTLIETKLRELGHPDVAVKFIQAEAPATWVRNAPLVQSDVVASAQVSTNASPESTPPSAAPVKAAPAAAAPLKTTPGKPDFKNDPLIKQALEIFKGQIVEVRV